VGEDPGGDVEEGLFRVVFVEREIIDGWGNDGGSRAMVLRQVELDFGGAAGQEEA